MPACNYAVICFDIYISRKKNIIKKENSSMMGCLFNVVANC